MNSRLKVRAVLLTFVLALAAGSAQAGYNPRPGEITIKKAKLKEKVGVKAEVDTGFAQIGLPIDFVGEAVCSCEAPSLVYTWDFGDGITKEGASVSHAYAETGAGTRAPYLKVKCSNCRAEKESPKLTVHVISGIRVDRIGDKEKPAADGRLSFPDELRVQATALPEGVSGSDKIDWIVMLSITDVILANTTSGNLPNPATWPTYNSGWGERTLYISIDGSLVAGQQGELRLTGEDSYISNNKTVKLFFRATTTENRSGNPNWYYYWTDALGNGPHSYEAGVVFGVTRPPNADIFIGASAYAAAGIPRHLGEKFIDAFGIIVNHERWHRSHRQHNIGTHGGWIPPGSDDVDGDQVCDREPTDSPGHTGGWEKANGTDPALPETHPGTIDREWIAQQNETDPNASDKDWAHPGSQWP